MTISTMRTSGVSKQAPTTQASHCTSSFRETLTAVWIRMSGRIDLHTMLRTPPQLTITITQRKTAMRNVFVATFLVATVTSLVWSQEPIRERIEWADIWVTDADKSDLPRVLLIGDSITRGYFEGVEKQLAGKAYCARLTTSKCVADPTFLDEVQLLLKQYRFTIIHFNNGLHGFGYTEEQYRAGLSALIEVLAKHSHDAKLIWATSTPMRVPNNLGQIAETTERVKARNWIAAELLRDRNIVTDDLYGLVEQHQEYFSGDGVHFNETGRELQAKQVAQAVLACLPGATASPEPAK